MGSDRTHKVFLEVIAISRIGSHSTCSSAPETSPRPMADDAQARLSLSSQRA